MTLADIYRVLWSKKWLIAAFAFFCAVAAAIIVSVLPPVFEARAALLVHRSPQQDLSAQISLFPRQTASQVNILQGILLSRTALDSVASQMGYASAEDVDYRVTVDPQTNQVTIASQNVDSSAALKEVEAALDALALIRREVDISQTQYEVEELRRTLEEKVIELQIAEDELLAVQESHETMVNPQDPGTLTEYYTNYRELQSQLDGVREQLRITRQLLADGASDPNIAIAVPGIERLTEALYQAEVELSAARSRFQPDTPEVREAESRVATAEANLQQAIDAYARGIRANVDPVLLQLTAQERALAAQVEVALRLWETAPGEALELQRVFREVSGLRAVVDRLEAEYQGARVRASVAEQQWSVLDQPYLLDRPVNKRLGLTSALGFGLGLLLMSVIVVIRSSASTLDEQEANLSE